MLREKQVQRSEGACVWHGPGSISKRWERRSSRPWGQVTQAPLAPVVRSPWIRAWYILIIILKSWVDSKTRSGSRTEADTGART